LSGELQQRRVGCVGRGACSQPKMLFRHCLTRTAITSLPAQPISYTTAIPIRLEARDPRPYALTLLTSRTSEPRLCRLHARQHAGGCSGALGCECTGHRRLGIFRRLRNFAPAERKGGGRDVGALLVFGGQICCFLLLSSQQRLSVVCVVGGRERQMGGWGEEESESTREMPVGGGGKIRERGVCVCVCAN